VDRRRRLVRRHQGAQGHRFDPATKAHRAFEAPDQVGWVLPAEGRRADHRGQGPGCTGSIPRPACFSLLHNPSPTGRGTGLNDATTDRFGRLWFGSMDDGESARPATVPLRQRAVHRFRAARRWRSPTAPRSTPDGTVLYHTDTLGRVIYRVPVNDDGSLGRRCRS
jgi:sugar lactone lactonase YvrE